MAGVLKPAAARLLIGALRDAHPDVSIHVHTHDTAGAGVASMLECAYAGADVVDAAVDSMSGMTSQPSMGAIVAALECTKHDTGLGLDDIPKYNAYWETCRQLYQPFESSLTMKSGNADVNKHAIPGGQYINLQFQAFSLGLSEKFDEVKRMYAETNLALGDIIKVAPSSKIVGDLAQFMVQNGLTRETLVERAENLSFPKSVVDFMQVEIEQGKMLEIQLLTEGQLTKAGEREVFFELNGQSRLMFVTDREASKSIVVRQKALPGVRGSIGAPMPGDILELKVKEGDRVQPKTTLFVLSAMKMKMNISTPIAGVVKKIHLLAGSKAAAGDLVIEI